MNKNNLVIVWRVTEQCNLACRFCAYNRRLQRPRAMARIDQVLAFGSILRDYRARYGREVLVSWLGGEPLCWPPLFSVAHTFRQEFKLRTSVTTNGTALKSPAVRERTVEDFDQITISLDGVSAFHDECRDAPGLYRQLASDIASLKDLRAGASRGPLIRVNTILMRTNLHQFETLCRELAEWGVDEATFNPLGVGYACGFNFRNRLSSEHVEWLRRELPAIRERMAHLGLTICGSLRYVERIVSTIEGVKIPVYDCSPGSSFLFVDESGLISPCSFTAHPYGYPLEEIRSASDLAQLPNHFAERKRAEMAAPCRDCLSTQLFGKFSHDESQPVRALGILQPVCYGPLCQWTIGHKGGQGAKTRPI